MSDRELLELAAKAAGYAELVYCEFWKCMAKWTEADGGAFDSPCWRPLTDDGDALRLAVKLSLTIYQWPGEICVCNEKGTVNEVVERVGDIYVATRRAIVYAAAKIGRQMHEGGAA